MTNLKDDQTGVQLLPQYYDDNIKDRSGQRWAQLATYSVSNAKGRKYSYNFTVADGNDLKVNIIIG